VKVLTSKKVRRYLNLRNLEEQFEKCCCDIESGNLRKVDFKKRQPKTDNIFQFRINRKFRGFGYLRGEEFFIFAISDHQN